MACSSLRHISTLLNHASTLQERCNAWHAAACGTSAHHLMQVALTAAHWAALELKSISIQAHCRRAAIHGMQHTAGELQYMACSVLQERCIAWHAESRGTSAHCRATALLQCDTAAKLQYMAYSQAALKLHSVAHQHTAGKPQYPAGQLQYMACRTLQESHNTLQAAIRSMQHTA
jgi:hypothetical protein